MQSLCRAKKISMTINVLPLHFAPSQASSSQNSNVDSYLQHCEVDSLKCSKSQSSLFLEGFSYLNHCGAVDTIAAAATAGGIIFSRGKPHAARWPACPLVFRAVPLHSSHHYYLLLHVKPTRSSMICDSFFLVELIHSSGSLNITAKK